MQLIDRSKERYMGATFSMHMLYSIFYLISSAVIIYSQLREMNVIPLSVVIAVIGFLFIVTNGMLTPVFRDFSEKFIDYVLTPIEFQFSSYRDYPNAREISKHIQKLRNDSGWEQVLYVQYQLTNDGDIVIDFISGKLNNQFRLSVDNLSVSDYSKLSCADATRSEDGCFACETEAKIYRMRTSGTTEYMDEVTYSLCEDCIDRIIETAVEEMDEDTYKEMAASNL